RRGEVREYRRVNIVGPIEEIDDAFRRRRTAGERRKYGDGRREADETAQRKKPPRHGSVGRPAAFPALSPPARWAPYGQPADCAASEAVTERLPTAQANTTFRPAGSGMARGSNVESGNRNASG